MAKIKNYNGHIRKKNDQAINKKYQNFLKF